MSYPRAVVALSGARDHYQLPLALDEGGLLHSLVTDLYWPADKKWFALSLGRVFSKDVIAKRFCRGLGSSRVHVSRNALGAVTLMKAAPGLQLNWYNGRTLSRKARQIAIRQQAALFCYSTCASEAFKNNGQVPRFRFLFQLHPHPRAVHDILSEEVERVPLAKSSLMKEWELSLSAQQFLDLCSEPERANGWVVASSFTARTLSDYGVPADRIHVVPYGVNTSTFTKRLRPPSHAKPFTAVYVGSLIQRKGLSYFLDSVRLLKSKNIRVLLCGRGLIDRELLFHYADLNLEIKEGLPTARLVQEIHEADVVVLPSLAEGFAHVVLETMACGLPVITTAHTCAPDIMKDGMHGFIVPLRDPMAIAEKLEWGLEHRGDLANIGENAAAQAGSFTWKRFRAGLREAYKEMVNSVR